jgi:hypothetical protein
VLPGGERPSHIHLISKILHLAFRVLHRDTEHLSVCPSIHPSTSIPPSSPFPYMYVPSLSSIFHSNRPPTIFSLPQKIFVSILKCCLHRKPLLIIISSLCLGWPLLSPLPVSILTTHMVSVASVPGSSQASISLPPPPLIASLHKAPRDQKAWS